MYWPCTGPVLALIPRWPRSCFAACGPCSLFRCSWAPQAVSPLVVSQAGFAACGPRRLFRCLWAPQAVSLRVGPVSCFAASAPQPVSLLVSPVSPGSCCAACGLRLARSFSQPPPRREAARRIGTQSRTTACLETLSPAAARTGCREQLSSKLSQLVLRRAAASQVTCKHGFVASRQAFRAHRTIVGSKLVAIRRACLCPKDP